MNHFHFNQLTQPTEQSNPSPPTGFNKSIAYTLGLLCDLSYQQYSQYPKVLTKSGTLKNGAKYQMIGSPFILSESIGTSSAVGQSGGYRSVPGGFVVQCTLGRSSFNVIAIRGTQTYDEWIKDADIIPTPFLVGDNGGDGYAYDSATGYSTGSLHGGFYSAYTQGTNGALPVLTKKSSGDFFDYYVTSRPKGSVGYYVNAALKSKSFNKALPLYVTGHSLGAALAVVCAYDIGTNFKGYYSKNKLSMYNLAGPPVAAGLSLDSINIPSYGQNQVFVDNYNDRVNTSFRIVNAADIVPISPPPSLKSSKVALTYEHVTPNNVTFCAQTGTISGNHSCSDTYVVYLEQLSKNFKTTAIKKTKKTAVKKAVKTAAKKKAKTVAKNVLKSSIRKIRKKK